MSDEISPILKEVVLVTPLDDFDTLHEIADTKATQVMVKRTMLSNLLDDHEALTEVRPKLDCYTSTTTIRDLRTSDKGNSRSASVDRGVLLNLLVDHSRLCAACHPARFKLVEPESKQPPRPNGDHTEISAFELESPNLQWHDKSDEANDHRERIWKAEVEAIKEARKMLAENTDQEEAAG
jgi:hypothetical protein